MDDWRDDPALHDRLNAVRAARQESDDLAQIAFAASTSPIEFLMAAALEIAISNQLPPLYVFPCRWSVHCTQETLMVAYEEPRRWSVFPQVGIAGYTADFILRREDRRWKGDGSKVVLVAIECDGHDYHDLTKEQAERDRRRDRRFQELGIRVARFTGREIWRDALSCARQAMTLAELAWQEGEYP